MRFLIFFALVFILINYSKSLSFCETFAENDYRISYGFRRITANDSYISYVFINQSYWRIKFTDHKEDNNKLVELLATEGKTSNWFGSQYSMCFCIWFENRCKSDKKSIIWGDLDKNGMNFEQSSGLTSIDIELDIVTAFVPVWGQIENPWLIFFQNKPTKDYIIFRVYDNLTLLLEESWKGISIVNIHKVVPIALKELLPGLEVIALIPEYSPIGKDYGLIVLFQFDRAIKYCYTNFRDINKKGCLLKPKILIDCSQTQRKIIDLETTDETNYILEIIFVILALIIFIVFVTTLWYYRRTKILKIYENAKQSTCQSNKSNMLNSERTQ